MSGDKAPLEDWPIEYAPTIITEEETDYVSVFRNDYEALVKDNERLGKANIQQAEELFKLTKRINQLVKELGGPIKVK